MNSKGYDSHFNDALYDPKDIITEWKIEEDTIESWVNLKDAHYIFVPVVDKKISRSFFYCTKCKRWFTIHNSIRNICRHPSIHNSNIIDIHTRLKKRALIK